MELSNIDKIDDINTSVTINDIKLHSYIVAKNEDMRLDKISYKLYDDPKYVTEIAYINGITDVFGIKEGDVLLLPEMDEISKVFNFDDQTMNKIQEELKKVNEKKKGERDINRLKDLKNRSKTEENKKLPPTIKNNDKVVMKDGKLIIKPNF